MAVEQRKSQVLDLSRPGAVGVEIDVAEAAEVLMSMAAILDEDDDTFDLGAEAIAAARAADLTRGRRADRAGCFQRREDPLRTSSASSTTSLRRGRSRPSWSTCAPPSRSTSSCTCSATTAPVTISPRPRRSSAPRAATTEAIEEFLAALCRVRPQAGRREAAARAGGGRRQGGAGRAAAALVRRGLPAALGRAGARPPSATPRPSGSSRSRTRPSRWSSSPRTATSTRPGRKCGRSSSFRAGGCGHG